MSVIMIAGGVLLVAIALFGAFVAGSDAARIHGSSNFMLIASGALATSALILAYCA